jgi:hypothetical protein
VTWIRARLTFAALYSASNVWRGTRAPSIGMAVGYIIALAWGAYLLVCALSDRRRARSS